MKETMNTILTRRSTRKFLNRPIPEEELQQIIQAALHAPQRHGQADLAVYRSEKPW